MNRTITDIIRRDCGFGLEVPEGDGWVRMPCPYCGSAGNRPPAVVNHSAGFFICHKCGVRRSASYDTSAASRFSAVLHQAAYAAWRTFPGVLSLPEARSYANLRLSVYAGPDDGSWAESGALERWQKATDGEGELDRYVLHALNCDLTDYARKLIRQKGHETPAGDGQQAVTAPGDEGGMAQIDYLSKLLDAKTYEGWEEMRDGGWLKDYPYLTAWKVDRMTLADITDAIRQRDPDWSEWKTRQEIEKERARLAAAFLHLEAK